MNFVHRHLCRSTAWRSVLERFVVPSALADVRLGDDVLELGPGDGISTDLLRAHMARLTVLEIDPLMAKGLAARLRGTNVTVVRGDATAMHVELSDAYGHHVADGTPLTLGMTIVSPNAGGVNRPVRALESRSFHQPFCSSVMNASYISLTVMPWRLKGGTTVGNGCVGDVTSPGTSDCGTLRSSMGHSGLPVTRSNT